MFILVEFFLRLLFFTRKHLREIVEDTQHMNAIFYTVFFSVVISLISVISVFIHLLPTTVFQSLDDACTLSESTHPNPSTSNLRFLVKSRIEKPERLQKLFRQIFVQVNVDIAQKIQSHSLLGKQFLEKIKQKRKFICTKS